YHAFALPLAQVSRSGSRVTLWGQVRPGAGRRAYVIQRAVGNAWRAVGGAAQTDAGGTFTRTVALPPGARVRLWAPAVRWASPAKFDWVLAIKGALVGLLIAGAYLHDYVLGPGLARQIREGKPQSLRPLLTTMGRANLLLTVAIPVLGVLLSEFLQD